MPPAVERSAVLVATGALALVGAVYLALALGSGGWQWWMAFGQVAALATVGALQVRTGRIDMTLLLVGAAAAASLSVHLIDDPHRSAVAMAVTAVAAVVWVVTTRRRAVLGALVVLWALQAVFPGGRSLLLLYQAGLFTVLAVGLGRLGASVETNRVRYQQLFEQAPVPLWEEDFSGVARWLDDLRRRGVADLRTHLSEHPGEIDRALGLVEVLGVNPAAAALIEVEDATGMLGRIDPSTFTVETRPAFLEQVMTVWNGAAQMTTELVGRTVAGRPIEAIMRWSAPRGPSGTPDYRRVVVAIDDVSELLEVQRDLATINAALATREQQLRAVVSGAPVVLFALDPDGVCTLAEGSGLGRLGETVDDLVGHSVFDRYRDRPDIVTWMRRALAGADVVFTLQRNDLIWEMRLRPVHDASGTVTGVIGVATDVTDRHRMEEALERVRRRHRLMVRHVTDLLYTIDPDGCIGFASPSVEATLGFTPDEVVGMTVAELVHPADLRHILEVAAGTPPGASTISIPHRVRRADGSWLHMDARAANLLDDPELSAWVVTARDITERVQAQHDLEAALDAAEAATRAKSELLANVSHEIRTPMNAILGMTDLALETALDAEQRDYLTTVRSAAENLLTIINDLLDLARVEAGHLTIEQVPFSVRGTLEDVVRTVAVRADEKGLALGVEVAAGVPEWVMGDPGRLRQVVMNLVGNAIKFTDAGEVRVRARPGPGTLVEFEVADTGIGIDAAHLDSIFEAFRQADGSAARRHGGTGLGLAISSNLVSLMGGTISVRSTPGEGSVFTFTADLPATAALTQVGEGGLRSGIVLVIAGRRSLPRLVDAAAAAGYSALGVERIAEALTLTAALRAEGRRIGAVVADFAEPDVEHCRRLTESDLLRGVPVLAVVAAGRRGDGARFRAAGVRAYLTTPLGDDDLREALAAIASGAAGRDALVTRHWLRERRRPLRVLLADDSATNRLLAVRVLERRGHRVTEVGDGEAALEALGHADFDVVLMDVQMPRMDGFEAVRAIREGEAAGGAGRVPVVALTAHASDADRESCLAAGMDGYLPKPFDADQLVAAVEGIAARARALPAGDCGAPLPEPCPGLIGGLEDAVAAGRADEVAGLAGQLAEHLGTLGEDQAVGLARRLESASAAGDDPAGAFEELMEALEDPGHRRRTARRE